MTLRKIIRLTKPKCCKKDNILIRYLKDVISEGYLTQGKYVEKLEKSVAAYVGVKYAVAVSSGTAALHLALLACSIGKKDRVIVPDFTFPATVNTIELVGAEPLLFDIQQDAFNLDPGAVMDFLAVSKNKRNIKAIIPVHQFGRPANMKKIKEIARKYKLIIIEDAACALGAEYEGEKVGAMGDVGVFSFHPRKIISTGEGGIVVTNNKKIAQRCIELRNHGLIKRGNARVISNVGFNYRLAEIPSLLGLMQMKYIEESIKRRIGLAKFYEANLKDISYLICPKKENNTRHVFQSYAVLLKKSDDRNKIVNFLNKNNIECGRYDYIIHKQPYYKRKYKLNDNKFKNSIYVAERILLLPMYPQLSKKEIITISNKIRSYFYVH